MLQSVVAFADGGRGQIGNHLNEETRMAKKKSAAATDGSQVYRERKKWELPCALTAEELETHSEELTSSLIEIEKLKAKQKVLVADIKNKIKMHAGTVAELTSIVHDRSELREVEVESVIDYEANNVTIRRLDTDEVIEDRSLSEAEKQMQMQLESDDDSNEEAEVVDGTTPDPETGEDLAGGAEDGEHGSDLVPDSEKDCDACEGFGNNHDGSECEACGGTGKQLEEE